MRRRVLFLSLLLCTSLVCSACTTRRTNEGEALHNTINNADPEEHPDSMKLDVLRPLAYSSIEGLSLEPGSYISIIGRYDDNSFWHEIKRGAERAVEDLNEMLDYKGDDKITFDFSAPDVPDDIDEQVNLLDEELSRNPVAIGIAAIDTSACEIQFGIAADSQIPIVTFDSGSDYQHIAAHISTNNVEAAKTAAAKLAYSMGESGEVAIFVQDSTSMTAKQRLQGFLDTIKKDFPDISVVTIYHLDDLESYKDKINFETELAEDSSDSLSQLDVINYIFTINPNIKGVYATNLDTTQLVANVVKGQHLTDVKIVGFDGGEEQMQLLKDGVVEGLILQNPYGMGYATIVAAARVSLGLTNEFTVDSGYTWVSLDNLEDPAIQGMLY